MVRLGKRRAERRTADDDALSTCLAVSNGKRVSLCVATSACSCDEALLAGDEHRCKRIYTLTLEGGAAVAKAPSSRPAAPEGIACALCTYLVRRVVADSSFDVSSGRRHYLLCLLGRSDRHSEVLAGRPSGYAV